MAARNIGDRIKIGDIAHGDQHPRRFPFPSRLFHIRRLRVDYQVPYFTTMAGADAAAEGIEFLSQSEFDVKALQDYGMPGFSAAMQSLRQCRWNYL